MFMGALGVVPRGLGGPVWLRAISQVGPSYFWPLPLSIYLGNRYKKSRPLQGPATDPGGGAFLHLKPASKDHSMTYPANSQGKVLPRAELTSYGTTLSFNFPAHQAEQLRELANTLIIKKNKKPSMALLARLAMAHFLDELANPVSRERVRLRLEEMVTPVPCPRDPSQLKAARKGF